MVDYCHLHNHTHYSLLDAACTPEQLIKKAKEYGHKSIALTDHGVMFGCLEFYNKAKAEGIKPILGFEAYVATGSRFDKTAGKSATRRKNYHHLLLLAKNKIGYKNLLKLTTLSHTEGFYYKPRIDDELLKYHHDGLIACSACINGIINSYLIRGDYSAAVEKAKFYYDLFGDDFYLELQNHNLPEDTIIISEVPKIASELGIKLVATNDIHYIDKEHAVSHNIYLHIRDATVSSNIDIENLRYREPQMYYKTSEEMFDLFKDFPNALETTQEISDKCDLKLEKNYYLPEFPIPPESKAKTLDDYLIEQTYKGLADRFESITEEIKNRVDYELDVIIKMGFSGYFLIVQDFIKAAKRMNVRVGPGRGSAAGSLVAYALEITNINPLPYDLLFERFLNPERVSMPDIDIDFSDDKRDLVISYVKQKYGENSVAQIVTFGKLSSKAVLKDVGRVLGIHYSEINKITDKIPVNLGKVLPLKQALELNDLKWVKESKDHKFTKLIKHSLDLEGLYRHTGTHAAGVVITPGDVVDYVPLYQSPSDKLKGSEIATQYDKKQLENAGLLKMDFLGLRTLSIIDYTLEMIKKNHNVDIDIDKIDYHEEQTLDIFRAGNTLGVFQFESSGMKAYLTKLKPNDIEEITAMNALYRPGPMENIPEFIERKQGRKKIEYLHPILEKTLRKTYGIIVYQEQVMQIARDVGGFSLGQADILRRAMGYKDPKLMEEQKSIFIEGAIKNGFDKKTAEEIYNLIKKFADYGFNKSHSLAYSVLAYQTAWLKAHYPAEFIAANMSAELEHQTKIVEFMNEAQTLGIKVMPPDVNNSTDKFTARDNIIYFSLAAIKNVGIAAAKNIMDTRNEKLFESFYDFVARVNQKFVNRKILEALIQSGAFDSCDTNSRATLFNSIDMALDYCRAVNNKGNEMSSLFGSETNSLLAAPSYNVTKRWPEQYMLTKEKEFLNFYVTGNPMDRYKNFINSLSTLKLNDIDSDLIKFDNNINLRRNQNGKNKISQNRVRVSGIINEVRIQRDRKKNVIAFAVIQDFFSQGELIFWSDVWNQYSDKVSKDSIVVAIGSAKVETNTMIVTVDEVLSLYEAIKQYSNGFIINVTDTKSNEAINELAKLCTDSKNKCRVIFTVFNSEDKHIADYLVDDMDLSINEETIEKIIDIFGKNNIKLIPLI